MSRPRRRALVLLSAGTALAACGHAPPGTPAPATAAAVAPPASGREVLRRMHDRWAPHWFTTISYHQDNTLFTPDGGESRSQWMEYARLPGRLRIDYVSMGKGSGILYEHGRVHAYSGGQQQSVTHGINPLLLLAYDVYAQPVDSTIRALDTLGVALDRVHGDTWQGARVWVVGADAGDTTSNQFWVSADSLLLVRWIETDHRAGRAIRFDDRVGRYEAHDGIPVATRFEVWRGGHVVWREEISDVKIDPALPDALFDPARWTAAESAGARR